jgi:hypothetical protein
MFHSARKEGWKGRGTPRIVGQWGKYFLQKTKYIYDEYFVFESNFCIVFALRFESFLQNCFRIIQLAQTPCLKEMMRLWHDKADFERHQEVFCIKTDLAKITRP